MFRRRPRSPGALRTTRLCMPHIRPATRQAASPIRSSCPTRPRRRTCSSSPKKRRGMRSATRRRYSIARCASTLSATATTTRICKSSRTTRRRSASSINNAAAAKIEGVQGTFEWSALDALTLRGNVGYNNAKYESYANAQCYPGQTAALGCSGTPASQNLEGKALLRAPELTYSLGADFSPQVGPGMGHDVVGPGLATPTTFQTATDYAPGGFQESFWLLNAGVRMGPESGAYEVALIGRNLTDEYYMLNVNGWSGAGNHQSVCRILQPPARSGSPGHGAVLI